MPLSNKIGITACVHAARDFENGAEMTCSLIFEPSSGNLRPIRSRRTGSGWFGSEGDTRCHDGVREFDAEFAISASLG